MVNLYQTGNLGLDSSLELPLLEPNLHPEEALRVDGEEVPYAVTQFSFQPNKDVTTVDTGLGVVRVAWPELESSGILSLTLEDVPSAELPDVLSLLNTTKRYRWLSFRGRRYRVFGFTPSYSPTQDTRYYRINLSCTAYRPHKALPPVPGTELYTLADVRRYGAGGANDEILGVANAGQLLVVFTSNAVCLWSTDTGWRERLLVPDVIPGQLSREGDDYYCAFGSGDDTLFARIRGYSGAVLNILNPSASQQEHWVTPASRISVPYSPHTHSLVGDILYYIVGTELRRIRHLTGTSSVIDTLPAGTRYNPVGSPIYLFPGESERSDGVQNVPTNVLGVARSGAERALVFREDGVLTYELDTSSPSPGLGASVKDDDGSESFLSRASALQRFGIFGNPGYPEGYWLIDETLSADEPYMDEDASSSPALVINETTDEMTEQGGSVYESTLLPLDVIENASGAALTVFEDEYSPTEDVTVEVSYDGGAYEPFSEPVLPVGFNGAGKTIRFRFTGTFHSYTFSVSEELPIFSDSDEDGVLEAPVESTFAQVVSVYSDTPVLWGNLRGVATDGFAYYPYTNQHVFRVAPLV